MEDKTKWIPDGYKDMDKSKDSEWVPKPEPFINAKIVCLDPKAKVC